MCTVTIVARPAGFRVACNRDERWSRPDAEPPAPRCAGRLRAIWPLDTESGGTWAGVNETGLVAVLLNRTPSEPPPAVISPVSRGTIVPALLEHASLDDAIDRALALPIERYRPFSLILVQSTMVAVLARKGHAWRVRAAALGRPLLFTSSSLGDDRVQRVRHALFQAMVAGSSLPIPAQTAFHQHRWRHAPELSVCMLRPDARTVSRTIIDVRGRSCTVRYRPVPATP